MASHLPWGLQPSAWLPPHPHPSSMQQGMGTLMGADSRGGGVCLRQGLQLPSQTEDGPLLRTPCVCCGAELEHLSLRRRMR